MNVTILIIQTILAIVFLLAGSMKLIQPKEKLAESMQWVEGFSQTQIRLIGVLEILGAVSLVLPALTGILPWLTPLAAVGLALLMVGAILTHLRRAEYPNLIGNIILLALTVFVAYGFFSLLSA